MGQNIKPSKAELNAMADSILRSKRKPDPELVALRKKVERSKKRQFKKEVARRNREATGGHVSSKRKVEKVLDRHKYGKLGAASGVRQIDPETGEAK